MKASKLFNHIFYRLICPYSPSGRQLQKSTILLFPGSGDPIFFWWKLRLQPKKRDSYDHQTTRNYFTCEQVFLRFRIMSHSRPIVSNNLNFIAVIRVATTLDYHNLASEIVIEPVQIALTEWANRWVERVSWSITSINIQNWGFTPVFVPPLGFGSPSKLTKEFWVRKKLNAMIAWLMKPHKHKVT